jgi:hypothetical protein
MKRKVQMMMSQGGYFLLSLFRGSNFNGAEEQEPLCVLELTDDQRAAAKRFHLSFPNGVTKV